ncbi:carbohydrate-binding module family 52 protein [Venturia nashicola]|uniref:Carbohydrate-binding module family 52 protein n=1 Tax=Venturia nashicola TaxID=86259 RepID=A0A4Z1PF20_9PEZI|nr:carbohydrate-binding module family 52 protein [Venturia nashicola]
MLASGLVVASIIIGSLAAKAEYLPPVVNQGAIKQCGAQQYYEQAYTCYDGMLCPIYEGFPYSRCGDGCYSSIFANCVDNKIVNFQPITKPFKLLAYNPTKLIVGSVEACGQEFHIKEGGACTYCPTQVGSSCPPGKETVLLPGAGMDTLVPGGQRYYMNDYTGALKFTQAHSGTAVNASFGFLQSLDGGAFMAGNDGIFVTCPSQDYKIYARYGGSGVPDDCFNVNLLTMPWNGTGAAAWQYT